MVSPSRCDQLRLLDSTPIPCASSRQTVHRSALGPYAAYGSCRAHSRWFWGVRLMLLAAPDGMPIGYCLAPANRPERQVAAMLLARTPIAGQTIIGDRASPAGPSRPRSPPWGPASSAPTAATNLTGQVGWAGSANASNPSSTPSKTSSRWNATAAAHPKGSSPE